MVPFRWLDDGANERATSAGFDIGVDVLSPPGSLRRMCGCS
jgi:hypothetical protein